MIHRIHSATSKCNLRAIETWSVNHTKILLDFKRLGKKSHETRVIWATLIKLFSFMLFLYGKQLLGGSSKYLLMVFRNGKKIIWVCNDMRVSIFG